MRKIDLLFNEYGESHRNKTNKLIHWICVPLIFWTIMGFVSLIPAPHFCTPLGCMSVVSLVVVLLVSLFYFSLSWRIGILMIFFMLILEIITYQVNISLGNQSWILYLTIFIITWIFQFIGHKIEGKKPSFLKDLQFLLVGPIWLLHFILKQCGFKY